MDENGYNLMLTEEELRALLMMYAKLKGYNKDDKEIIDQWFIADDRLAFRMKEK